MNTVVDAKERAAAICPTESFCVSAPAGSGKTELLIQRYLALLSRVERPEQVLAITFTRKAAAEMRERVLEALNAALAADACDSAHQQVTRDLAEKALAAGDRGDWQLLRDISRLNIKTIDSFCAGLTRQMPILSQIGGQATAQDDATELYEEAVVELFGLLQEEHAVADDLAALMLHFDNNWERLQELLVSMLARREQWRSYIGVDSAPEESEAYLVNVVEALVREELAQLQVLLDPHAAELLELLQYSAASLNTPIPELFPGGESGDLPGWRMVSNLLLTKTGDWRKALSKNEGFPNGKGEAKARKEQLKAMLARLQEVDGLHERLQAINTLPAIESGSKSWQLVLHLSRLLPVLAAELLLVFQKRGIVDHSQVAQSALQALGGDDEPTELALRLDYQIEHILVDEFQDTAINQFELIQKLTRGWGEYNEQQPQSPRTLLIVGDGMQSIYGFRGANVGLFLKARSEGFNGVILKHLELRCNFRSDQGVVDWVNETFRQAFPGHSDANRAQVSYNPATAVRSPAQAQAVALHGFLGDSAQDEEVAFICRYIATLIDDGGEGTIAVLGRNRSHLQPIIKCLKQKGIAYNAPDLDSLAQSPLVADLMTLSRALANDADRLAWLALLRAPWCGLQLADLLTVATCGVSSPHSAIWTDLHHPPLLDSLSEDASNKLQHILPALQQARKQRDRRGLRAWIEQAWVALGGPQCAVDLAALHDAENFMQLLEEAQSQGVGLDITWLSGQLQQRYMSAGDPDSRLQLMTLHKAKGLEFGHVIIPALNRLSRSDSRDLLLWDEHTSDSGERRFFLAADDHSPLDAPTLYNYLRVQRQRKSLLESTRLLYVGATRAISNLLLTASLKWDEKNDQPRAPAERSLLSPIWPIFRQQMTLHEPDPQPQLVEPEHQRPQLLRLRRDLPGKLSLETTGDRTQEENNLPPSDNWVERSIGTVVHLALEELSLRPELPDEINAGDTARWRMALQREGLWGEVLEEAWGRVYSSLQQTLRQGGRGRWVLSAAHPQSRSEWSLTAVDEQGHINELVIDRTFIDAATGERWLVDYKNSQPLAEESLEAFTIRESRTYEEQLLRYRDALRQLGSEPLRCALFFTALGHLHPVSELDLPASEG